MSTGLIELSNSLSQSIEDHAGSLVAVHAEARGSCSGVVWQPGVVVTAEHALRRDEEIGLTLPDGRVVAASLAGRDPSTDIAVLNCAEAGDGLRQFGDVTLLKPGNLALVAGRTRASGAVASLAVVSMVAAERRTWTGASLAPYIRLDVALQPIAVGGAVIDVYGGAVGVVTSRFARFGAILIPAPTVNRVIDTLLKKGHIPRGYLGVGLQPIRLPEAFRQSLQRDERTAVIILEVEPEGPASKAGIVIGDILISLAGRAITRVEDVYSQLTGEAIAKSMALRYIRGGAVQDTNIIVGERPHGDK